MRLLLLGADGQVGWRLRHSLPALGDVTALTTRSTGHCGDLRQPEALAKTVRTLRPDVVVNAAGWTDVDGAERDPDAAFAVNATACEVLAHECHALGAWLVHYSSDYVYDGSGERPWTESDAPHPLNVYGRSKLAGDQAIAAQGGRHLVLRTSWVYDSRGRNFPKAILQRATTHDSFTVVDEQWGAPTSATLIADVTAQLLQRLAGDPAADTLGGLYHLAASSFTSRHACAALLVRQGLAQGLPLRATPERVMAVPSADMPGQARRPANSRLDTSRLQRAFGLTLPAWQTGVQALVEELAGQVRQTSN